MALAKEVSWPTGGSCRPPEASSRLGALEASLETGRAEAEHRGRQQVAGGRRRWRSARVCMRRLEAERKKSVRLEIHISSSGSLASCSSLSTATC